MNKDTVKRCKDAIPYVVVAIITVVALALVQSGNNTETISKNQELCTQMGKVMETEKAVAVGSMCCTEYTCLEIKR